MSDKKEYLYAEILLDKKIIEGFPNERSAHFQSEFEESHKAKYVKLVRKLNWHINNSLSRRQKEVLKLLLKRRAVNKLRQKLRA
jgi:hypothetical protein